MNDRTTSFRDFVCDMLGTARTAPLIIDGAPVNGATLAALLAAFQDCHPDSAGDPSNVRRRDPLGLLGDA